MIKYERFTLPNGLKVLVHEDHSTPMAVVNVLYDVGAKDEDPEKTGFAHLFEHLMFGGSVNIPVYDAPLQIAGGENNAYTTNDLTNYYLQLPAENLETGLWLESDRMFSLAFGEKSLEVQKKVVTEEFKEHYINKPYGDMWHIMRDMAYTSHPYKWMTIGKDLKHIEQARLQDVKNFFFKHYRPQNAILVVAGKVKPHETFKLVEKYFGDIPQGEKYNRNLPQEPVQSAARRKEVTRKVPIDAFLKCYHISSRLDQNYYVVDLITEILSGGGSSRLFQKLVKDRSLFSDINCYHFGSVDAGMLAISGKLVKGVSLELAEKAVEEELEIIRNQLVSERELEKVKNKIESMLAFEDMNVMNRANSLAFYELLGDASMMNEELNKFHAVTAEQMMEQSRKIFDEKNSNTLYYLAKKK